MKPFVSMSHGLVVLLLLLVMISLCCTEARVHNTTQQLEVQQYLKRLNKPAVKSIKSPDGDIIDCVHISHQPAFDHPLLKNHTIQMRPSFHPLGLHDGDEVASEETGSIPQLWHQNGRCPEDTIPIRRIKEDDVLRASSVERFGKKIHRTVPNPIAAKFQPTNITGRVGATVHIGGDEFYGAKAIINVWNPKVQSPDEYSGSQIFLSEGRFFNCIQAGWHVHPSLYGDHRTRLFGYWSPNWHYEGGCWNLVCPGFVQVSKDIALGAAIDPISSYDGRQYDITLMVYKDSTTMNWWLVFGNSALGYWPTSLLSNLNNGASIVEWGGEVLNHKQDGQHTTTEMGSGHFAEEHFGKASYFKNIKIVFKGNFLVDPKDVYTDTTESNCYNVELSQSNDWGYYFYYGGPGRNPNCP